MRIHCLAIANRGEVAVRIIQACKELKIETLLLHSEVDVKSRAYRMADRTLCIGGASVSDSYLNKDSVIKGALAGGAQAIHPGFGFLSENSDFVRLVRQAGLIFVGPPAEAMEILGNKILCKELAKKLGVPLVPGYQGANQELEFLISESEKIGYPLIVKAAMGGGGRGMKIITNKNEAKELILSAQREALVAFGSSQVFLEKYLDKAKHIEFQVFVDSSGQVVHFYDRECSVQRRHQKIIEEARSPLLSEATRQEMAKAATCLVGATNYQGAATVEFLWQEDKFYLLEVNTRLQVEHPVTEMVMGIDLVKAQILTAEKNFVWQPHQLAHPKGHAIECRIYAEDPYQGGIPSTGILGSFIWPEGPGRRFDYGFEKGDEVTSYYDSMIAKVIVWDETRERALLKMKEVLGQCVIFGVQTNIPYLQKILSHPEFISGHMTTQFISKYFQSALIQEELDGVEKKWLEEALRETPYNTMEKGFHQPQGGSQVNPFLKPWRIKGEV